ncbi:MAG: hypothetical protein ACI8RD_008523 [Bacillariaceae sp.]|jgi:hypothetical protein
MIRSAALTTAQVVRTRISTFSSLSANGNSLFGLYRPASANINLSLCSGGDYGIRIRNNNRRYYTPMTIEEEEKEKARCSHLSPEEKETELRSLNREISKLETLRGINNGERYTWSGRYKELVRNYGFPLFVYYWSVWTTMGISIYIGIDVFGFDAMSLLDKIDTYMNWSLGDKVDPQFGKMGLALVVNECFEPIRLPFVVITLKPVMDQVSPTKY